MTSSFEELSRRHMWWSWFGGLGLVLLGQVVVQEYVGWSRPNDGLGAYFRWYALGLTLFLGLPALLGAWVRRWAMQWAFATAASLLGLLWRTILVVEGTVLLLMLLYLIIVFALGSDNAHSRPIGLLFQLFFGLSLPWLLSSVVAAVWLRSSHSETCIPNKKQV
ncbi:hypothetical protein ACFPAF_16100 [Hymenobacter endophyticus]|uniref:Uncharacterized protein n=1 Tax=Hymenobacter endophyticus TaxID=3076335 RepID=A0ABU3TKM0_9BACT|nr:hypothetical protein [Hymenobacter endophyticus]MDU0371924.1 hypothetical protein [Hymenobacter endophyticus]